MASTVNSAARGGGGGTIASAKSAPRGGTIVSAKTAARGGTVVSLAALGALRKDSRRRGTVVAHMELGARLKDPSRHRMMSGRWRHGRARGDRRQVQPAREQDGYEEDDAEDGYKSPPGSPQRDPLPMKWQ